jgi:cell division septation protein DedD
MRAAFRLAACVATMAALAACSGSAPKISAVQEAAQYKARARGNYTPPGPPGDPWGPYIVEAAAKYDMPELWIREVIRAESSGNVLDTSGPGAMGLMQVMPATYDELRQRYGLNDDPYDPHDNVMAGTAYMRELYDLYGSPGFLAAYNAGPGRLDDYLTRHRGLPDETRNYVAKIAPRIAGVEPQRISPASQYAMNQIPINIPRGPRYPSRGRSPAPVALAENRRTGVTRAPVQMAALPEPVYAQHTSPAPQNLASLAPQPAGKGGFHLIPRAMADTLPHQSGGPSTWAIQVGAFGNEAMARAAAEQARSKAQVASAHPTIGTRKQANAILYRARLTNLTRESAVEACDRLSKARTSCIVLSPDAQS